MFTGTHERAIDEKGRLIVPTEYRSHLSDGAYLGKLESCLGLWDEESFTVHIDSVRERVRLGEIDRNQLRVFFAETTRIAPDSQGRIQLNAALRLHAGLDDLIVFNGGGDHIEIWQEARWRAVHIGGDEQVIEAMEIASL